MAEATPFQPGPNFKFPKRTFGGTRKFCCDLARRPGSRSSHFCTTTLLRTRSTVTCVQRQLSEKQIFASKKQSKYLLLKSPKLHSPRRVSVTGKTQRRLLRNTSHHREAVEATITQPKTT